MGKLSTPGQGARLGAGFVRGIPRNTRHFVCGVDAWRSAGNGVQRTGATSAILRNAAKYAVFVPDRVRYSRSPATQPALQHQGQAVDLDRAPIDRGGCSSRLFGGFAKRVTVQAHRHMAIVSFVQGDPCRLANMDTCSRTRQSGFTLLELMMTIAVAAIFTAIAVPSFRYV